MTIKLYTTLKDKIAPRVEVEAATAAGAIAALRAKHTAAVDATLVDKDGVVRNHFTLTLNSRILDPNKLDGVSVKDGDLLHIFPPIAGGVKTGEKGGKRVKRGETRAASEVVHPFSPLITPHHPSSPS